ARAWELPPSCPPHGLRRAPAGGPESRPIEHENRQADRGKKAATQRESRGSADRDARRAERKLSDGPQADREVPDTNSCAARALLDGLLEPRLDGCVDPGRR